MISPDQSFAGYLLLRQVGLEGFGEIWICQSEALRDLRALKFIPSSRAACLDKEFYALGLYRKAAGRLRSPSLMSVEHANLLPGGLFYGPWRTEFPREKFAAEMDSIAADLYTFDPENTLPPGTRYKPLSEIKERFLSALQVLPPMLDVSYQLSTISGVFPPRRGRPLAAHGNAVGLIRYKTLSPEGAPHDDEATLWVGPGILGCPVRAYSFWRRFSHGVAMG